MQQPSPKCWWLFKEAAAAAAPNHCGVLYRPLCLSGKCQGVIDIFLTAPFIFVPCFRFYDLGSCWPLPVHSFLSLLFGPHWKWLDRISMGCLSFETIFSSLSYPQPLWRRLFILRSNFSACCLIWDLLRWLCPPRSESSAVMEEMCWCYCPLLFIFYLALYHHSKRAEIQIVFNNFLEQPVQSEGVQRENISAQATNYAHLFSVSIISYILLW